MVIVDFDVVVQVGHVLVHASVDGFLRAHIDVRHDRHHAAHLRRIAIAFSAFRALGRCSVAAGALLIDRIHEVLVKLEEVGHHTGCLGLHVVHGDDHLVRCQRVLLSTHFIPLLVRLVRVGIILDFHLHLIDLQGCAVAFLFDVGVCFLGGLRWSGVRF